MIVLTVEELFSFKKLNFLPLILIVVAVEFPKLSVIVDVFSGRSTVWLDVESLSVPCQTVEPSAETELQAVEPLATESLITFLDGALAKVYTKLEPEAEVLVIVCLLAVVEDFFLELLLAFLLEELDFLAELLLTFSLEELVFLAELLLVFVLVELDLALELVFLLELLLFSLADETETAVLVLSI